MNASAVTSRSTAQPPRPRGEWFSRDGRARFGWIHEPAPDTALGIALVIVPPFGYEAVCAHRSLRSLAEAAIASSAPRTAPDSIPRPEETP